MVVGAREVAPPLGVLEATERDGAQAGEERSRAKRVSAASVIMKSSVDRKAGAGAAAFSLALIRSFRRGVLGAYIVAAGGDETAGAVSAAAARGAGGQSHWGG